MWRRSSPWCFVGNKATDYEDWYWVYVQGYYRHALRSKKSRVV